MNKLNHLYAGKSVSLTLTNLDTANDQEFLIGGKYYASSVDANRKINVTSLPTFTVNGNNAILGYERFREEVSFTPFRINKLRIERVSALSTSVVTRVRTTIAGLSKEDLDILDINPNQFQNDILEIPFLSNIGVYDALILKVQPNKTVGVKFWIERIAEPEDFGVLFSNENNINLLGNIKVMPIGNRPGPVLVSPDDANNTA